MSATNDRPRPTFSANELRASLGLPAAAVNDPEAMTLTEIAIQADIAPSTAHRHVLKSVALGTWICVGPQRRLRSDGVPFYADGYKPAGESVV